MQNNTLRIIFFGDIIGRPGRKALHRFMEEHRNEFDFCIANCENTSGGKGITKNHAAELLEAGIDVFTSGNHIWRKKEVIPHLDDYSIIRPLNYPQGAPGSGSIIMQFDSGFKIGVINILGRVFMGNPIDCPFRSIQSEIERISSITPIIFVDFYTETTSEKKAMGYFLDGKVSCMVGTHTHIQTNDAQILPKGTAYITDAGMCGPNNSIIGVKADIIIQNYLTQRPAFFEVETEGDLIVSYVIVEIDKDTGKALDIRGDYVLYKE